MDEPLLFVTRLDDLASMALTENPYERAAVYAATHAIYTAFLNSKLVSNHPVMELVRLHVFIYRLRRVTNSLQTTLHNSA